MQDELTGRARSLANLKPFQPGNPGRPKGSRNKLGEAFVSALQDDFEEHGVAVIQTVRAERPHEYLKVIASLLPKELKVTTESDLTDDQLNKRIKQLAAAVNLELRGGEAGAGSVAGGTEITLRPN